LLLGLRSCFFVLSKLFLGGIGSTLLFVHLLDVHIFELVFDFSLLIGELCFIGFTTSTQPILEAVVLVLALALGLREHVLVVIGVALHEVDQLIAHLLLIVSTHCELVTNGLLLGLNLVLLFFLELGESIFFGLFAFSLNLFDACTLFSVVIFF